MSENLLKNVPLFSSLDNTTLEELWGYLKKEIYPPHHTIFWMNEKGDQLYIIASGRVQISYIDEEGQEITLNIIGPGSFFGELSLIDNGPHVATARTVEETALLTLDRATFYSYLDKHPQLFHVLMQVLTTRLRDNTDKMRAVVDVNKQLEAKRSIFQTFVDNMAKCLTSSAFLTISVVFIVAWIVAQVYLYKRTSHAAIDFLDTPPTFFFLGFLLTLTSFLLTVLILNSQRRLAKEEEIRNKIEYHVNLKAQAEVMKLQLKMDQLLERVNKLQDTGEP
ncbi:cyclic nucleotide-binding domain-containing protein [Segetibacter aerophilus]|nr:cyclic nucleotide-binding domain-containing protein [Segetibacter aerophilus]